MSTRYAVYYTPPPTHALWHAGCDWLQRDPAADEARPPTRADVHEPWRYGFHATLKPPMRLAAGRDEAGLRRAVEQLAQRTPRFEMPALSVQWLSDFIALRPVALLLPAHPLRRLADDCVTELDAWRAPASPEELQRRAALPLDATQREMLQRYGYPHVLGQWRFHMTLSNALPADDAWRAAMQQAATRHFAAALSQPLACDALSLFVEPAPGQPFRLLQRYPLA
ncbi:DUF1045 domain-containing protein [Sphaerotilaceae bacterium SBD11-9]